MIFDLPSNLQLSVPPFTCEKNPQSEMHSKHVVLMALQSVAFAQSSISGSDSFASGSGTLVPSSHVPSASGAHTSVSLSDVASASSSPNIGGSAVHSGSGASGSGASGSGAGSKSASATASTSTSTSSNASGALGLRSGDNMMMVVGGAVAGVIGGGLHML